MRCAFGVYAFCVCAVCTREWLYLFAANAIFHHFRRYPPQVHPPCTLLPFICLPTICHTISSLFPPIPFYFLLYTLHYSCNRCILRAIYAGKKRWMYLAHWIIRFELYYNSLRTFWWLIFCVYVCTSFHRPLSLSGYVCVSYNTLLSWMVNKLWTTIFYCLHFQRGH